jgi:hypothetical protein
VPDFLVKLTVEVHISARSMEAAEERANQLYVEVKRPPDARWYLGDIEDLSVTVERTEE